MVEHADEIFKEYTRRYNNHHKSELILKWCINNTPQIPDIGFNEPPECMGDQYKLDSVINSYRKFYNEEKVGLKKLTWDKAPHRKPDWIYL